MILLKDTIVELVANTGFGWGTPYRALARGERRFYKVIKSEVNPYREGRLYTCMYIDRKTKKRKGSWEYYFYEGELRPYIQAPINLQDWM